jgi:hypothetical protein
MARSKSVESPAFRKQPRDLIFVEDKKSLRASGSRAAAVVQVSLPGLHSKERVTQATADMQEAELALRGRPVTLSRAGRHPGTHPTAVVMLR